MPGPETANAEPEDSNYQVISTFNDAQRNTNPSGGRSRQSHGGNGRRRRRNRGGHREGGPEGTD